MSNLFTIGYANKRIDDFIKILKLNNINCIVDVRTMPFSKQYPDYNENNLAKTLKESNITYMSFKNEFGARRIENEVYQKIDLYDDSFVDVVIFEKVYNLEIFKKGYNRVEIGLEKGFNIAFLCSEKYAYDCHRCIMVAEFFYRNGYEINHIVDDKNTIMHKDIEKYLEDYFKDAKSKFVKLHANELQELTYGGGLFQAQVSDHIIYWNDFFAKYTREKGFYLRNLEIGYKKGNEDYD